MNYQSKTKEELIRELQQLKEELNSTKSSYKAEIENNRLKTIQFHESEEYFRLIFEGNSAAIAISEPDSTIILINDKFSNISGYTKDEIIGKSWKDLVVPEDLERLKDYNRRRQINPNEVPSTYEFRYYQKNGSIKYAEMSVEVLKNRKVVSSCIDITERKKIENEIHEVSQKLVDAQAVAKVGSWETDLISFEVKWTNETYRIFDLDPNIFHPSLPLFFEFIHPEDRSLVENTFQLTLNSRTLNTIKHRIITPKGETRYIEENWRIFFDNQGLPIRALGTCSDITARTLSEQMLRESENRFKTMFEEAPLGVAVVDSETRKLREINSAFATIVGRKIEDLKDCDWMSFTHPDDIQSNLNFLNQFAKNEIDGFRMEKRYIRPDGSIVWVNLIVSRLNSKNEKTMRYLYMIEDITERKQISDTLQFERTLLRTVIDNIPDTIYCKDLECRKILSNLTDVRYLGAKSEAEVLGKNDFDFYPQHIAAKFYDLDQIVLQSDKPEINVEESLFDENGKKIWLLSSKIPMHDKKGKVIGLLGIGRDITESKSTEDQLRKLLKAVEQSPASIVITNPDGNIEYVNPTATKTTGYSLTELMGKNPRVFKSGETSIEEYRELWDTITHGNSWRGIFHNKRKNGELYWESSTISPIIDDRGQITNYLAVKEDITERKKMEDALQSKTSLLEAQINATNEGLLIVDENNKKILINQRLIDLIKCPKDIAEDENDESLLNFVVGLVKNPQTFTEKVKYLYNNNHEISKDEIEFENGMVLYRYSAPICGLNGKNYGRIWTFLDITENKIAEKEIKSKNEELQKVNAEKDKFFSIIAHDLRSPFNGFLGFTEILANDLPQMTLDEIQNISHLMKKSANDLYELLGNLLEWSRIQGGLINIVPETIVLSKAISESLGLIIQSAMKKEIKFEVDIPEDLMVFTDANILQGIIRNLANNAVKFTPKGGHVYISAKSGSNNSVEISIKDTGIGMNKQMIDNLFRLDINTNRKGTEGEPSTGMGLIISKDLIEKLSGGTLYVESEEGKGTNFHFSI